MRRDKEVYGVFIYLKSLLKFGDSYFKRQRYPKLIFNVFNGGVLNEYQMVLLFILTMAQMSFSLRGKNVDLWTTYIKAQE